MKGDLRNLLLCRNRFEVFFFCNFKLNLPTSSIFGFCVDRRDQSKRATQQKLRESSLPRQHECSQ